MKLSTHHDEHGRVCTMCKTYKLWEEYGKRTSGTLGHYPQCKACARIRFQAQAQKRQAPKKLKIEKSEKIDYDSILTSDSYRPTPPRQREYWEDENIVRSELGFFRKIQKEMLQLT